MNMKNTGEKGARIMELAPRTAYEMTDEIIKELKEALAALKVENEMLRAEVERLSRYYKNGIDCFAVPCERHSGERTPPFAEFFERYGGQCLICAVDNNKALQERLTDALLMMEERERRDEALLRQALDVLFWTTGSEDFSEGGLAREGALELLFPTIDALHKRLGEKEKA